MTPSKFLFNHKQSPSISPNDLSRSFWFLCRCGNQSLPRCSDPSFPSVNPSNSPSRPLGLGTGHSLRICFCNFSASASIWKNVDTSSSAGGVVAVVPLASGSSISASFLLLRLIRCTCCLSVLAIISESARVRRGAGHGKTCGRPTTNREAKRVVAKREDVDRERGWRCGGIINRGQIEQLVYQVA